MTISFELPKEIAHALERQLGDLDRAAKEALLLESFREGRLGHYELSQALSLDRFETDALLKQHSIFEGSPTLEDLKADRKALGRVVGPVC